MTDIGIGNLPPGCNPTDFDELPELRPMDDAGMAIGPLRAAILARNFEQHLEDLDQLDAWLRDNRENSLRLKLEALTKAMKRRLMEVQYRDR